MSIFSQMKRAHKHKEQSTKPVEQSYEKPNAYKHIPTHAASDAITGSPASWDAKERTKIREENRKRSAMAAAQAHAHHMNMSSASQGGSGSSSVAFTSGEDTPMIPTPGAISWSIPNYSSPYSEEDNYARPSSHKGKEVDRRGACYFDSPHESPSSNKGGTTPQESSRRSLSSQDVLDTCMKPVRSVPVTERPATTVGLPHPHRLHPSSRRTSDASIDRPINPYKTSNTKVDRDPRPPPSMRGFHALPQLPQMPPIRVNTTIGGSSSPTSPSLRGQSSNQSTPQLGSSRRNSLASLPNLTPTSTRFTISTPPTPTRTVVVKKAEFTMLTPSPRSPSMNFDFQLGQDSLEKIKMAYDIDATPRSTRNEFDPFIDSSVHQLDFGLAGSKRPPTRSYPPQSYVVNIFPEPSSPPNAPPKSRRKFSLSKTGSKLLKKKRWSISKPISISDPIPIN